MRHVHLWSPPEGEARRVLEAGWPTGVRCTEGPEVPDGVDTLVQGVPKVLPPGLERLIVPYSGLARRTRQLLLEHPEVVVHNLHHNAGAVAEMALALLLSASRRVVPADQALRQGDWSWRYRAPVGRSLAGRKAVVVGYGAIGKRVARLLVGIGMHVVAVRRAGRLVAREQLRVVPVSALDEALTDAAAVVVACPSTPETAGLFDAERLARLPPDATLVNVARSRVVDDAALYVALVEGRLHAAGLDVWRYVGREGDTEPTWPSDAPLHTLANVVLSPHRSGHVEDVEVLRMEALVELLRGLSAGRSPNRVDVARGY